MVERLAVVMRREYIRTWLIKPNQALDDKPLDVIAAGGYRRVSRLISALESTAVSDALGARHRSPLQPGAGAWLVARYRVQLT